MERRQFLRSVGGVAVVGAAGCLGEAAQGDYDVGMSTDSFKPATVTVTPGTTVVWQNTSSHAHTVTAFDGDITDGAAYFASGDYEDRAAAEAAWKKDRGGAIDPGESFEHTFEVAGTYDYFCIPHLRADMVGTVEVDPDA